MTPSLRPGSPRRCRALCSTNTCQTTVVMQPKPNAALTEPGRALAEAEVGDATFLCPSLERDTLLLIREPAGCCQPAGAVPLLVREQQR